MMSRFLYFFFFSIVLTIGNSFAQNWYTTIILIRHAEKMNDGTKDPALTEKGRARADSLVAILGSQKIDAIYSTAYVRTRSSVTPLAQAKGLAIQSYDASNLNYLDKILSQHAGGTVVVCGHSNTIPAAANYLVGGSLKNFEDQEYSAILIAVVTEKGKGKLIRLNF